MIAADDAPPPGPKKIKGNAFFPDTAEEAEGLAKAYLGWSEPEN
jgi:hypothetical protein